MFNIFALHNNYECTRANKSEIEKMLELPNLSHIMWAMLKNK